MRSHHVIKITSECERDDCTIEDQGTSSTCMGSFHYYDKQGEYHIEDPNYYRTTLYCHKCLKSWHLVKHQGETSLVI